MSTGTRSTRRSESDIFPIFQWRLFSTKFADDPAMLTQDEQFKLELDMIWTTLFRLHEALRPQEGRLVRFGKQMRPTVLVFVVCRYDADRSSG